MSECYIKGYRFPTAFVEYSFGTVKYGIHPQLCVFLAIYLPLNTVFFFH